MVINSVSSADFVSQLRIFLLGRLERKLWLWAAKSLPKVLSNEMYFHCKFAYKAMQGTQPTPG